MRINKNDIVNRIPGGWYGNDPGTFERDTKIGNVGINPKCLVAAIKWLSRRAVISETSISQDISPGVLISYYMK